MGWKEAEFIGRKHLEDLRRARRRETAALVATALTSLSLLGLLAVALALLNGCAHKPTRPVELLIPERIGGPVATAIGRVTGDRPKAVTLPGAVVYRPKCDACCLAHERTHVADAEAAGWDRWYAEYGRQLKACTGLTPTREDLARCTGGEGIEFERRAYAVETGCRARSGP